MWFVARDIAFDHPVTADETSRMLDRMGIGRTTRTTGRIDPGHRGAEAVRVLPHDVDAALEALVGRMIGLLLIEISAFHGFRWAEAVLGDTELVAGDGAAGRLVSYIRSDETPHVAWLRTALSEMRDRTWVGDTRTYPGTEMVGLLWDQAVSDSLLLRRQDNLDFALGEIALALAGRPDGDDVLEEMLSLGPVTRGEDGRLSDPAVGPLLR